MIQTERNERLYNPEKPGAGAVEFARAIVAGMTEEQAAPIIEAIIERRYHDPANPKIKDCAFCGYVYRDITKNNSSKVCSRACKAGKDAEEKRRKRREKGEFNRYKASDYEVLFDGNKIEQIAAARQRYDAMGGRAGRRATKELYF